MTTDVLTKILFKLQALPGETEIVEFKEAKEGYDFTKLGKYFSALSNEANLKGKQEAWLVFGIENKHRKIIGSKYRDGNRPQLDSLKSEIANKTTNRMTFIEIYELDLPEGRVVMFQIPPAPQGIPVAFEGHYYGRDGEDLSPLNLEEIERIRKQVQNTDWSAEICPNATLADLDKEAIAKAREEYKKKFPAKADDILHWSDKTFLNKAKVTVDGKITNTAMLLLGSEDSYHLL